MASATSVARKFSGSVFGKRRQIISTTPSDPSSKRNRLAPRGNAQANMAWRSALNGSWNFEPNPSAAYVRRGCATLQGLRCLQNAVVNGHGQRQPIGGSAVGSVGYF